MIELFFNEKVNKEVLQQTNKYPIEIADPQTLKIIKGYIIAGEQVKSPELSTLKLIIETEEQVTVVFLVVIKELVQNWDDFKYPYKLL